MKIIRKRPGELPELVDMESQEDIPQLLGGNSAMVVARGSFAILYSELPPIEAVAPDSELRFQGTVLVVGVSAEGRFCAVPRPDEILWKLFQVVGYTRADRPHNVWKCRHWGHLEQFEADGPYENGWDYCPGCGGVILQGGENHGNP